ncbi:protein of unknown function [Pseudodesulfovibrio piezophilus C1TLV30]|uniref:Uncharacterized protein n=1 Tax=Pseudodesulfovibrio piezophilus (strain DSM 21447 / JCM 15486 / C1TLV30) TaxID=1322246 RepID=M1WQ77_PSEP2|nr:protein of unknown function [Pseudodesulfovibrio piezophilus C1TLV30]
MVKITKDMMQALEEAAEGPPFMHIRHMVVLCWSCASCRRW